MLEKPLDILKLDFANSILLYIFIVIIILCIPLQPIVFKENKFYYKTIAFFSFIILTTGFQLASNVYSNSNNIDLHNKHYNHPEDTINDVCAVCMSYKGYQWGNFGLLILFIFLCGIQLFRKDINIVIFNICLLFGIITFIFGLHIGFYFQNTENKNNPREDHKNKPIQ